MTFPTTRAPRHAFPPLPAPLLPLLKAAERHVRSLLRCAGTDPVPTARATVCYELSMLALGYHDRLSEHCAAMTAAHLLFLAAAVERETGIAPREPEWLGPGADLRALERDAAVVGSLAHPLTQEQISTALGRFRQAVAARAIDLVSALHAEFAGKRRATRAAGSDAPSVLPPPFIIAPAPGALRPRA